MLTSNLYPSFSNNGFAASNISACGVGDAPTLIVLSSLLPDEQPVNNPTANVDTNNTFANFFYFILTPPVFPITLF